MHAFSIYIHGRGKWHWNKVTNSAEIAQRTMLISMPKTTRL
jgi:hypothetical protein